MLDDFGSNSAVILEDAAKVLINSLETWPDYYERHPHQWDFQWDSPKIDGPKIAESKIAEPKHISIHNAFFVSIGLISTGFFLTKTARYLFTCKRFKNFLRG